MLIDFPSSNVVFPGQGDVQITLVIAKIKVNFTTIVEYKAFAVSTIILSLTDLLMASLVVKYSRGFIRPASMFIYGSILIDVTFAGGSVSSSSERDATRRYSRTLPFIPILFKRTPRELATDASSVWRSA